MNHIRIYPSLGYGIGVLGNETNYNTWAITSMIVSTSTKARSAGEEQDIRYL